MVSEEAVATSSSTLAWLEFKDAGKIGVCDWSGDQYFSSIRSSRILARGERGEINNLTVRYLQDVDAPAVIFDEALPSAELVPVLVTFIDALASDAYDRTFDQLIPSERQEVVVTALEMLPEMGFAVQMVKLAAYTAPAYQELLGYPGANGGYVNDPLFTFGTAMSQPHPATVGGNFP